MHRRSAEKFQARRIRRIIIDGAFRDRRLCEDISRMARSDVIALLNEPVVVHEVPDVEHGEVLNDNRGRGTLQLEDLLDDKLG